MGYKSAADGITKKGRTKGKNFGDSGPVKGIEKEVKGEKIYTQKDIDKVFLYVNAQKKISEI